MSQNSKLAINGGAKAASKPIQHATGWPHITEEDEYAVLEVLRAGSMSGTDVTKLWEKEFAEYLGVSHCLGFCNGTAALLSAMWSVGVGVGDEIICPTMTYWASALPCYQLGATAVFADIEPHSLCIDPNDIERHISDRTKAIIAVHYGGYPADMDPIMAIAEKHNLKVIEDVSHSHGGLYKGRMTGSIGHVAAMSCMSGKSLVAAESGMFATNDRVLWERAIAFGHYSRHGDLTEPDLVAGKGFPWGGVKHRANQLSSALGRVQLRHYNERMKEIDNAMNHFWDLLEGCPGIKAHRPPKGSGSTMGGWYAAKGLYRAEELDGLPLDKYCEAVRAEGCNTSPGANKCMHLHPVFNEVDIYGHGKPTCIANADRDVRQPPGSLPVAESIDRTTYHIPWFKRMAKDVIEEQAAAFRKVAENADQVPR